LTIVATHTARYWILEADLSGAASVPAGVLLEDPAEDRLWIRLRRDWAELAPEEAEVLEELEADLEAKAREFGCRRLMRHLEETLSNALRISEAREIVLEDFERGLARLYREQVRSNVRPFVTHLPRYSLAVAAGKFLENSEVHEEGWEEAPADLKLAPEMFIASIAGHSMEPKIPDGSLCVFRQGVAGSRQGRLVLVEQRGGGANDRYTVKRYRSVKTHSPEGTWRQERITLEALNPEYPSWDLDPEEDRFRILAEFVRVLD
jgi:phage repressor protein C with HTH and peptisase S24 domain